MLGVWRDPRLDGGGGGGEGPGDLEVDVEVDGVLDALSKSKRRNWSLFMVWVEKRVKQGGKKEEKEQIRSVLAFSSTHYS